MRALFQNARGTEVASSSTVQGWAIDAGAGSGTGVDLVQIWAYPNPGSGQPTVFMGTATYGGGRPDVGAAFGAQFYASGFSLSTSLPAGYHQVVVFAHSSVTGTFSQSQSVYLTVHSGLRHALELPAPSATASQPSTVSGWAVETAAASGTGVDTLHIWAYPSGGGPAVFVGVATYGVSRPDVGGWLQDTRFTPSGFVYPASGLAPGLYQLAVFPHSSVTGTFGAAMTAWITVQ